MEKKVVNTKKLYEAWAPTIKKATGVTDSAKLQWMSEMAHNRKQSLNESADSVFHQPAYNTLFNTVGIGDPRFPQQSATSGNFADPKARGTGDVWNMEFDIALQAAAKTIGTELVNTKPINAPTGALGFWDYVYSGGKQPYGPQGTSNYPNPNAFQGKLDTPDAPTKVTGANTGFGVYRNFEVPNVFKVAVVAEGGDYTKANEQYAKVLKELRTKPDEVRNAIVEITSDETPADMAEYQNKFGAADKPVIKASFIGVSRLSGDLMFRTMEGTTGSLGAIFGGPKGQAKVKVGEVELVITNPRLVSAIEDHIQGYTGAGQYDADPWAGTYHDGTVLYEPMSRGVGELTYPRQISGQMFVRKFEVGTFAVSTAVTDEMITDYQKVWNIDAMKMLKEACANEISQNINKHILSRLFGLGWKNHVDSFRTSGTSFNVNFTDEEKNTIPYAYPVPNAEGDAPRGYVNIALPYSNGLSVNPDASSVNGAMVYDTNDGMLKRVQNQMLLASNWIAHRGRRGGATFAVMGPATATALQITAQYTAAPIANTISQVGGNLYPAGQFAGMQVYVDPLMDITDTRVLVGRKGALDEPGVVFCPYQLAHSIDFVSEGTGSYKAIVKSRYALVNTGFYPELYYLTFDVKLGFGGSALPGAMANPFARALVNNGVEPAPIAEAPKAGKSGK